MIGFVPIWYYSPPQYLSTLSPRDRYYAERSLARWKARPENAGKLSARDLEPEIGRFEGFGIINSK